jgi:hypothetical protein
MLIHGYWKYGKNVNGSYFVVKPPEQTKVCMSSKIRTLRNPDGFKTFLQKEIRKNLKSKRQNSIVSKKEK